MTRKISTMAEVQAALAAEPKLAAAPAKSARLPIHLTPVGGTSVIRILPNGDPDALLPYSEKRIIRLPFAGVEGGDYPTAESVVVAVPSLTQWGGRCPIEAAIKPYWKGDEDERTFARTYWRKQSYVMNVLAVSLAFVEEDAPENAIRLLSFGKQLLDRINHGLSDPDLEIVPWAEKGGRDLKIQKTLQGGFNNYSLSGFTMKPRDLSEKEMAAIEQYGLPDLTAEIGEQPGPEYASDLMAMFRASISGQPFDADRFPAYRAFPNKDAGAVLQPAALINALDRRVAA